YCEAEHSVHKDDDKDIEYAKNSSRVSLLCNNSTIAINFVKKKKVVKKLVTKTITKNKIKNPGFKKLYKVLQGNKLDSTIVTPTNDNNNNIILDESIDINLVYPPANNLTTAKCKINNISIFKAVLDIGLNVL
ncbi:19310_t:CDS:2, partial [Gigaspora margarita]